MVNTAKVLLMLVISTLINTELNWKLTTKPIIFGNETILTCFVSNSPCAGSRAWFGGKDSKFLCGEDRSSDPSKYELMLTNGGDTFAMKIKNIDLNDVNCRYACSCGFEHFTKDLILNDSEYVYLPSKESIEDSSFHKDDKFLVNITLKGVYPQPVCKVKCDHSSQNQNVNRTNTEYMVDIKKLNIYNKTVELYDINLFYWYTAFCIGQLVLTCDFRSYSRRIANWTSNITHKSGNINDQNSSTNVPVIVAIVFSCILGMSLLLFMCISYVKKARMKESHNKAWSEYCLTEQNPEIWF